MATTIITKFGSGAPTASDVVRGELAVDTENKRLYTEDSGGSVVELGTNPAANVTFGDNVKAVFGAGSDLQIYHTGSVSVIEDSGTGNLLIRGSDMRLQNAAGSNNYLKAVDGAEVELMHGGATKLATTATGIDVTGTVTADGSFNATSAGSYPSFRGAGNYGGGIGFIDTNVSGMYTDTSGANLKFFTNQSASDAAQDKVAMTIDGSGNVGIGTSSPAGFLEINGGTGVATSGGTLIVRQDGDASTDGIALTSSDSTSHRIWKDGSGKLNIGPSNLPSSLVQDLSGNVGIGTDSPTAPLHVAGSSSTVPIKIDNTGTGGNTWRIWSTNDAASDGGGKLGFYNEDTATRAMTLDSSGSVGIGTSSPASDATLHVDGTDTVLLITEDSEGDATLRLGDTQGNLSQSMSLSYDTGSTNALKFIANGTTERMRIDSSGNVAIGTGGTIPTGVLLGRQLVVGSSTGAEIIAFREDTSVTAGDKAGAFLIGNSDTDGAEDHFVGMWGKVSSTNGSQNLHFAAGRSGYEGDSPQMTLDSSGNLLVGTDSTTPSTGGFSFLTGAIDYAFISHDSSVASGNYYIGFRHGTNNLGAITQNGTTGVLYNTSSDQRLKDNIVDAPSASDDIDAIQVRSFDWKADGSHQKYGMVAQELQTVAPEAVSAPEDPEEMMGVDYSKLVPMMLKEIQQLRARVAQLEGAN